jgi:hypothetical protein
MHDVSAIRLLLVCRPKDVHHDERINTATLRKGARQTPVYLGATTLIHYFAHPALPFNPGHHAVKEHISATQSTYSA